jgi:hypothetical protein
MTSLEGITLRSKVMPTSFENGGARVLYRSHSLRV